MPGDEVNNIHARRRLNRSSGPPSIKVRISKFIPFWPSISLSDTSINCFLNIYARSRISLPMRYMICKHTNSVGRGILNLKCLSISAENMKLGTPPPAGPTGPGSHPIIRTSALGRAGSRKRRGYHWLPARSCLLGGRTGRFGILSPRVPRGVVKCFR